MRDGYDGTSLRLVTEDDLKELGIKGGPSKVSRKPL